MGVNWRTHTQKNTNNNLNLVNYNNAIKLLLMQESVKEAFLSAYL